THFDLANNYGPPPGSAEERFGRILATDLRGHRDDLVIATKAGYHMRPGPYGEWGSRKYLLSSLDASLTRLGLDYVDIFYHHRPDPNTPLEETMAALDHIVRQGKALYVGISQYKPEKTREAAAILAGMGTRLLIHQPKYNMLDRWVEDGLLDTLGELGVGCIPFSPLAQGLLTGKYLKGVPDDSRAARNGSLQASGVTPELVAKLGELDAIARRRGQSLAQLALTWVLRDARVTSALIGARTVAQLDDSLDALKAGPLSGEEIGEIEAVLA
ncbi:MAG: aldo/keto reductase, partial [Bauldia sp.]|nr:aldo/keto reductase [Bauldia sp.]